MSRSSVPRRTWVSGLTAPPVGLSYRNTRRVSHRFLSESDTRGGDAGRAARVTVKLLRRGSGRSVRGDRSSFVGPGFSGVSGGHDSCTYPVRGNPRHGGRNHDVWQDIGTDGKSSGCGRPGRLDGPHITHRISSTDLRRWRPRRRRRHRWRQTGLRRRVRMRWRTRRPRFRCRHPAPGSPEAPAQPRHRHDHGR